MLKSCLEPPRSLFANNNWISYIKSVSKRISETWWTSFSMLIQILLFDGPFHSCTSPAALDLPLLNPGAIESLFDLDYHPRREEMYLRCTSSTNEEEDSLGGVLSVNTLSLHLASVQLEETSGGATADSISARSCYHLVQLNLPTSLI